LEIKRAKEIAASPLMANVTYNGSKVYIENVNELNNSANIHYLNQPYDQQEISLNKLKEHDLELL
jgi:small acid-soluble spore protein H (minor)